MRRKEREVTDWNDMLEILDTCKVLRIAVQDKDGLYIVPVNFGYTAADKQLTLFFHSAKEGRKVDAFAQNNAIAFEMDCEHHLIESANACEHSYAYRSIIGSGHVHLIEEPAQKKQALNALMQHQTGKEFAFSDQMLHAVLVYRIAVDHISGKQHL